MAYPFFAGEVAAHRADRLPQRQHHHSRGRHAGARHRYDLGCRHPDLGGQPDRRSQDAGIQPSRRMQATPYEILRFIGRGKSLRDYQRLKAALDRLQSTTVATSIRETTGRRLHRFSWINEWKELADANGTPLGIELILPDWFYAGVLDAALVLTIDPTYFRLTGGIERWLYRRCASMAAGRNSAGSSTSGICTASRAAARGFRTLPTTCGCWSPGNRCRGTSWASCGFPRTTWNC